MTTPADHTVRIASPRRSATQVMTSNERLRAAASFSPFNIPSCMTVRTSYGNTTDNNPTLAAIAGPMGITILDITMPHRPWLVLDYASTIPEHANIGSYTDDSNRGGIRTMAFQPAPSIATDTDFTRAKGGKFNQPSNSILLATARGSGILIWDCSGRAISPLMGRLNVSDAWSRKTSSNSNRRNHIGMSQSTKDETEDTTHDQSSSRPPLPPPVAESTPVPGSDLKGSGVSISSTSSQATSNAVVSSTAILDNLIPSNTTGATLNATKSNSLDSPPTGSNTITSIAWKGSASPILLATVGSAACLFDLRTLFSGDHNTNSGRPFARFLSPDSSSALIHCSFSHDETIHMFATLDEKGVVRLWDERKCSSIATIDSCVARFTAHTKRGVGIAAIPLLSDNRKSETSRWITWGLDLSDNDNLIVKMWDSDTTQPHHNRAHTVSTVSTDEDDVDINQAGRTVIGSFHMTASTSIHGAAAVRVHPLIPENILAFRPHIGLEYSEEQICSSPILGGEAIEGDSIVEGTVSSSPMRTRRPRQEAASFDAIQPSDTPLTPSLLHAVDPPSSVTSKTRTKKGWEAQLIRLQKNTMETIASINGGGIDEDALCIAPCKNNTDISGIIAVELAHTSNEILLCSLTETSFKVYRLPEFDLNFKKPMAGLDVINPESTCVPLRSPLARVFKKSESASWWNQSEEDVFGDVPSNQILVRVEDKTSLHAPGRNLDRDLSSPVVENILKNTSIEEVDPLSIQPTINESNANVVIDLNRAKHCPCPPLCGISLGKGGKLVVFNNGPVKKLWASYLSDSPIESQKYNDKPVVFNDVTPTMLNMVEKSEKKTPADHGDVESQIPRTLFDLIEMQSVAKIAQWGVDLDNNSTDLDEHSPNNSSTSVSEDQSFNSDDLSQIDDSDESFQTSPKSSEAPRRSFVSKFDSYFAESRKSLTHIDMVESISHIRKESKQFTGIASLSPSVTVSSQYDNIFLNGQSSQLANILDLGDAWWLLSDFTTPTSWEQSEKSAYPYASMSPMQIAPDNILLPRQSSHESSRSASMVGNLKKMFTIQSPSVPPDQRLFKNKKQPSIPSLDLPERQYLSFTDSSERLPLAMYVSEKQMTSKMVLTRFTITRSLCLRNAKTLRDSGEKSKADTWTLLAQAIQSLQAFQSDDFDGWGGANDVLTTGLVKSIFEFYESVGDYQMLATMVCVLTLGRDRRGKQNDYIDKFTLIPQCSTRDRIRIDNYIHRYAELAFSWGNLALRNELSKRLAHASPEAQPELERSKQHRVPVIECSICCNNVRGASISCPKCGHGGHLEHMISWFQSHQTCPTGCGCACMESISALH